MNYPLREGLIEFILGRGEEKLRYAIEEVLLNAPKRIRDALMNILGTHDTERIITLLGEQKRCEDQAHLSVKRLSKEEKLLAKRRLTALSTVLYTLPGIPSVFYGDEVGLEGYHDPFNRMPYPYGKEDRELLSHFRLLGKIRRENEVYIEGDFSLLLLSHGLFAFKRVGKEYSFVTLVTVRKEAVKVGFDEPCLSVLDNKTDTKFELSSTSTRIFKIKNGCNMYLI